MPWLASGGSPPETRCAAGLRTRRDVIIEPPLRTHNSHAHYPGGAVRPCPVVRSRCGRARCPHRAAAPSARCAAWHRAHAESFACRGSVRGTVRGRAAHPARCHDRAAIYPRALPGGAMRTSRPTAITHARSARKIRTRITHGHGTMRCDGDIAPYRHYARKIRTRITRAHRPWGLPTARGGSPPREANRTKTPSMASDQVP